MLEILLYFYITGAVVIGVLIYYSVYMMGGFKNIAEEQSKINNFSISTTQCEWFSVISIIIWPMVIYWIWSENGRESSGE